MYLDKVWKLTLQRDEVSKRLEFLKTELILKDKQIESTEMKNTEEITIEVMKNESLEKEIARFHISQVELEEKVKEQQLLSTSEQTTVDTSSILEKHIFWTFSC